MCGAGAQAQVTPVNWYHFGETDGVAVGQPLTTANDTVGTKPLTVVGNSLVSSDIGPTAFTAVGSSRSLQFATRNTDYARIAPTTLTAATDNFGLEVWVKPSSTSTSDQVIVYNGNFGFNGFGIVLKAADNKYYGQFGPTTFGGATATIGTWTHLAIVRDNSMALLYVNGTAVGATEFTIPTSATIGFGVGNGLPAANTGLQGFVDEVRYFTFSPGFFSPTQLLTGARRVFSNADSGAGSLRAAMIGSTTGDTISIATAGPIVLAGPLPIIPNGINIYGIATSTPSISGGGVTRVFFVDNVASQPVTFTDVSITNGKATGGAGGGGKFAGGGGMGAGGGMLINNGSVVLSRVNFSGNAATGGKGGNSSGSGCGDCTGGGGGLGGAGGTATGSSAAGGGGGWLGAGGAEPANFGASGGGGVTGNGGQGGAQTGGGGGAYNNGGNGNTTIGGAGADGIGGKGGDLGNPPACHGVNGLEYGGGGGAAINCNGGNGGRFGGGGGATIGSGGSGGDYGGGGGGALTGIPGNGGFGGGSGGESLQASGNGGFGGGSGGSDSVGGGVQGAFAGKGGVNTSGAGGGGGAALGGAIFLRASNGASLTWNDSGADFGTLTGGAGGSGSGVGFPGGAAGGAVFALGGTTTFNVTAGTRTISGAIAGPNTDPPNLTKTGTGTLVLSGSGSNLGVIAVNKGDLRLNSSPFNLAVGKELDVNNTGTLSGVLGQVGGPVKLASGGTISPGDPTNAAGVGTFTMGELTWNAGGVVAFQLGSTTGIPSDLLNVSNLTKAGSGTFRFNLADGSGSPTCGSTYTLVGYSGTTTFVASDFSFLYSGLSGIAPASFFTVGANKVQFTAQCFNNQVITNFVAIPASPPFVNGGTFGVSATPGGGSGALTYGSNTPSVCSVVGATVTMNSRGVCTLTANQAGDTSFNPAPTVLLTLHFEQFTVNASAGPSPNGTVTPPTQQIDYNTIANFTITPDAGFTAQVTGNTCSVTHGIGDQWSTGPITTNCDVSVTFIDRIFADGFQ